MQALSQTVRTTADADAVRDRILDAAECVFAAHGFAGGTTREIACRAGIQKRMLFYYFASKDELYRAVLERIIGELVRIHERFRTDPGAVGLAEATAGIAAFAAANLDAVRVLLREIMDAGPHLPWLAGQYLGPLFARGAEEVARNVDAGVFRRADPMHVLMNVGGLTLFYLLNVPLLKLIWARDPLAPATLEEHAATVRDVLMHGLAGPAAGNGRSL
jgi:TetR/AcrR family transcriptional regulator